MIFVAVVAAVWIAGLAFLAWEAHRAPLLDEHERPVDEADR